jgi:capsular polysaccharide biosynthesis protein
VGAGQVVRRVGARVVRAVPGTREPAPPPRSMYQVALASGWKKAPANRALIEELDRRLSASPRPDVAVLVGKATSTLAAIIETSHPTARVHEVAVLKQPKDLHALLAAHGPYDLVVDDLRRRKTRAQLFRGTFWHLRAGGAYVVVRFRVGTQDAPDASGPDEPVHRLVTRLAALREGPAEPDGPRPNRYDVSLGAAIDEVTTTAKHLVVTNRVAALAKIREEEIALLLRERPEAGRIVRSLPAIDFAPRYTVSAPLATDVPAHPRFADLPEHYRVPALSLREYDDVVCAPHQLVLGGNVLYPDSFRHNYRYPLRHGDTVDQAPLFASVDVDQDAAEPLAGPHYYLDNEHRGHFGHALTEVLSKLWGWQEAKRAHPDLRLLLAQNRDRDSVGAFEWDLFAAAGVAREDVTLVGSPVRVERLVAAAPMFSQPAYIHPDIAGVWDSVGRNLESTAPQRDYPARIFCTRRLEKRWCHNVDAVEAYFADHGFEVVRTEEWSMAEQATMFRRAEAVAGFAGSAMFSLLFCERPIPVVLLTTESYTSRNEYLIAAVRGHHLDVVTSQPDIPRPGRGWHPESFESPFTFDFEREGRVLDEVLTGLGSPDRARG